MPMGDAALIAGNAAAAYAERMKRIMDAVELRQPDRVPTVFYTMFWHARYGGMTCRDAMYDYDRVGEVVRRIVLEFQPDTYALPHPMTVFGAIMERIGYRQMQWPGHGTDVNVSFQYLDREYMNADEYEDYLFDPTGFYLSKYLPRIAAEFDGLARLKDLPGQYYIALILGMRHYAHPQVTRALTAMREAGEEARRMLSHAAAFGKEMADLGFPQAQGAAANAPFDYFGDNFRGSKGIMLDMYRRKDQLIAAMDKAGVFILRQALAAGAHNPSKFVFIPIHWAFDGFMSLAQFKVFFWPSFRTLLIGLIDGGLIPMVLWEGDCTSRLEVIADIPRGKAVYWFERTDLARAKEVLGSVVCLRGNVPASMMTTGTPEQVDACCRGLIETVGRGGGFILDGGIGIPDEAKTENVRAMFEAARRYSSS
jgi:hypothetical protein